MTSLVVFGMGIGSGRCIGTGTGCLGAALVAQEVVNEVCIPIGGVIGIGVSLTRGSCIGTGTGCLVAHVVVNEVCIPLGGVIAI